MNKKYFLMFGLIGLFAVALVTAALLPFFGQHTETIEVTQPITVNGEEGYVGSSTVPCWAGQTCEGTVSLEIENHGTFSVPISVGVSPHSEVETVFFATTTLTKKVVDFNADVWYATEPAEEVTMRYAATGDSFVVEVTNPITDYELVYYKDNSDRFNSPALAIPMADVTGNLPYSDDANADASEENEYCTSGEYDTCSGAKIWYVPATAILAGNELDWSMASQFYFETELIQFNNDMDFIMYPNQILTLIPSYIVDPLANTDNKTVTIEILPTA